MIWTLMGSVNQHHKVLVSRSGIRTLPAVQSTMDRRDGQSAVSPELSPRQNVVSAIVEELDVALLSVLERHPIASTCDICFPDTLRTSNAVALERGMPRIGRDELYYPGDSFLYLDGLLYEGRVEGVVGYDLPPLLAHVLRQRLWRDRLVSELKCASTSSGLLRTETRPARISLLASSSSFCHSGVQ